MPGIVGVITRKPRTLTEPDLERMLTAIQHERFYASGTWVDESLGVYVGWTALKGSFSDAMPLFNEKKDVCLIFSGEEYGDPEAAHELRRGGHSIGSAESAYLVHLYEEDPEFIQNLNGMFHGLIADRTRGVVTLFNDRYGMHRLYYYQSPDAFYFASEAKAILAVCPELRVVDPRSLGEFAALSCVLENRTIFKDIQVMPGASAWTFRNGQLSAKVQYFNPRTWEEQETLAPDAYYRELSATLLTALPKYLGGRQQTGIAMTGGLDTRLILACHSLYPGPLPSYTIGSHFRDSQDVVVGRKIAKICEQPHQVITIGDDFLGKFAEYAERSIYLTEGTVDVYRASDLYVSERVREIAPAKVVGTYGSEILRHAVMFKPNQPMAGLYTEDFVAQIQPARDTYTALRKQHPVTFAAFTQSPWYHHGILAIEQSQLTVRSPFMDNDFVRTVYRAPKFEGVDDDVRLRLIQDWSPTLGRVPSDRGIGGVSGGLAGALKRAFHEFTFKAEYAYDYGMPQPVARVDHALSALHMERLFLGRHKMLHFRIWYRDQLSKYVCAMLLDPRTLARPYVHRKTLETVVADHVSGRRNYTTAIHKLITLELLHRRFLDAQ